MFPDEDPQGRGIVFLPDDKHHTIFKLCIKLGAHRCLDYLLEEVKKSKWVLESSHDTLFQHFLQSASSFADAKNIDKVFEVLRKHVNESVFFHCTPQQNVNWVHLAADKGNLHFIKAFNDAWPLRKVDAFAAETSTGLTPAKIAYKHVLSWPSVRGDCLVLQGVRLCADDQGQAHGLEDIRVET